LSGELRYDTILDEFWFYASKDEGPSRLVDLIPEGI